MQAGLEWSEQEADKQGLQQEHFCDFLLFLDADQVCVVQQGCSCGTCWWSSVGQTELRQLTSLQHGVWQVWCKSAATSAGTGDVVHLP